MQRRGSSSTFKSDVFSDTADVIRARTALLADMPYRRSPSTHNVPLSAATQTSFYTADDGAGERFYPATYVPPPSARYNSNSVNGVNNVVGADVIPPGSVDAAASTAAAPTASSAPTSLFHSHSHSHTHHHHPPAGPNLAALETVIERPSPTSSSPSSSTSNSPRNASPSGLSRMFAREKSKSRSNSPAAPPRPTDQDAGAEGGVPRVLVRRPIGDEEEERSSGSATPTAHEDAESRARSNGVLLDMQNGHTEDATETSRLLPSNGVLPTSYGGPNQSPVKSYVAATKGNIVDRISSASKALAKRSTYSSIGKEAVSSIPAVILGMLLNILDGVSYGFIMFPTGTLFAGTRIFSFLFVLPSPVNVSSQQVLVESACPCSSSRPSSLSSSIP